MNRLICMMAVAATVASAWAMTSLAAGNPTPPTPAAAKTAAGPALNFTLKDIDGQDVNLDTYAGKVVMMVNVASKCGNTHQYSDLEAIYNKYKDKGFVVLGFPANNFGQQEPGTDAQIKTFCTSKFQVTFPMFSKISVKGSDMAPLYKYLTSVQSQPEGKGDVKWNFEKFLIGRDGTVINRFENKTSPSDPTVIAAVEAALKK